MKMNKRFQVWCVLLVVLLWGAVGCNSVTPTLSVLANPENVPDQVDTALSVLPTPQVDPTETAEPTPTQTSVPETPPPPLPKVHPADMRTGIEEVDRVLDALFEVDGLQFQDVAAFISTPCVAESEGIGGPPECRESEADGDLVDVFIFSAPSMHYLRRDEIDLYPGVAFSGVYAIYRIREEVLNDSSYPAGSYGILCIGKEHDVPRTDVLLRVTTAGVIGISERWNEFPQDLLSMLAREDIIVAPVE